MTLRLAAFCLCLAALAPAVRAGPAEDARAAVAALALAMAGLDRARSARDRVNALTETEQAFDAGLAALRAAAAKDGRGADPEDIKDRLAKIVERDQGRDEPEADVPAVKRASIQDRLSALLDRSKPVEIGPDGEDQELDDEHEVEKDRGRDLDSDEGWSL